MRAAQVTDMAPKISSTGGKTRGTVITEILIPSPSLVVSARVSESAQPCLHSAASWYQGSSL